MLSNRLPAGSVTNDGGIAIAIATIVRMTGGNLRLVDRLVTQIDRIQKLDGLTPEVVDTARQALLIGRSAAPEPGHLSLRLTSEGLDLAEAAAQ